MDYEIRTIRPEDWAELRELRLAALRDPIARVAFIDTYDRAAAQPDDHWRARATPIADGGAATNLIATDADGRWVGMLALLDETGEQAGGSDEGEGEGASPQIHIVSVYVRTEHRGTGAAEQLFRTAIAWTWENTRAERIRLFVHGDNPRALAFYTRLGFAKTGVTEAFPPVPEETEHELVLPRGFVP